MTNLKVMTDSSAQLTPAEIEKYHITVVPLSINIDGQVYTDGVDLTREEFVEKMDAAELLPETSQPSVGLFAEKIKELTADGSHVLGIFLSSGLSGTIEAARQAAEMVPGAEVTCFDSKYTDRAQAFQVLAACQDIAAGKDLPAVLDHLHAIQDKMHLDMMVVNLKNIIKGGRLGPVAGRVATLLNIRIAITMTDGKIDLQKKGRGKKFTHKYVEEIIAYLAKHPEVKQVGISYVDTPTEMEQLADRIKEVRPDLEILTRVTSPIVAIHAGREAFAVMFYPEQI
ncbi:MAG: DegV family protein [Lactobacillus sp.]|nr:DegV family protein [Lactobacillus sp.]MCH3906403.1 DegV family protein [Lactobacillus sp.]MCH3990022.1 DegV family protein [Lactobacillus sp.]MCH4069264.1 DegV family protein [Lactobacillus sp.]MCI1303566.1 DegV family protein [Lactobacillus sp.]